MSAQKNHIRLLFIAFISLLVVLLLSGCMDMMFPEAEAPRFPGSVFRNRSESVIPDPGEAGSAQSAASQGYAGDESTSSGQTGQDGSSGADYGPLKPVGFVNYGEFDATVRASTYIPLGETDPGPAPAASTVSSAKTGSGTWPNTSRFISVPMGAYSWCIDWETGEDLDEDGYFDYFHYIQNDPTILDENDSDVLESAEEVMISAPPSAGAIFKGKCKSAPVDSSCAGKSQSVQLYTSPGWVISADTRPEVIAHANSGDFPPPEGISISAGGGYALQKAWILYEAGHYLEATTGDDYTAIGVQPHGESYIGWARILFDGVEVWRGDTSSYYHDAEGYLHAVYVEVRCFPPGEHTLRIEALGIEGSGGAAGSGGRTDVPIAYFGFRP